MKKKWKKIIGGIAVLAILGMIISQSLQPLRLELLKMKKRDIAQTFIEEGLIASASEYSISTVAGGKIVRLPVTEGQKVEKGALLVEIDSRELAFQADQLRAQLKSIMGEETKILKDSYPTELTKQQAGLEQAKGDQEAARKNFDRISALYDAGAVSSLEYENTQKTLKEAENTVAAVTAAWEALLAQNKPGGGTVLYYAGLKESLESQIENLTYQIDQCTIEAPAEGTIAQLSVKEGETVSPRTQVMTLLPNGLFKVEAFVLTEDVADLQNGMQVKVIQDKLDQDITFPGTVSDIAPSAVTKTSALGLEEQRVKVTVLPDVPAGTTLRPGYALDIEFKTAEEKDRLVVPKTAVFSYQGGDTVWVVRQGKASIQPISKGLENEAEIAVAEGLQEGDLIVLDPQSEGLKEGKKLKPLTD
jgi:HlyD family secretion protein